MHLLLAEDDALLGRATARALMQQGNSVDWVTSAQGARVACRDQRHDCILLSLDLPDVYGDTCLRDLRSEGTRAPVVVTSAKVGKEARIQILDLGADDYVAKPYDVDELAARLRAVVRRSAQPVPPDDAVSLVEGTLVVRAASQTVMLNGEVVVLTSKEFALLTTLLRQRGRVVTRQRLEEALYGWNDDLSSNTIEVYVHQVRRKLGRGLIETIRGVGYRLAESVAPARR